MAVGAVGPTAPDCPVAAHAVVPCNVNSGTVVGTLAVPKLVGAAGLNATSVNWLVSVAVAIVFYGDISL